MNFQEHKEPPKPQPSKGGPPEKESPGVRKNSKPAGSSQASIMPKGKEQSNMGHKLNSLKEAMKKAALSRPAAKPAAYKHSKGNGNFGPNPSSSGKGNGF